MMMEAVKKFYSFTHLRKLIINWEFLPREWNLELLFEYWRLNTFLKVEWGDIPVRILIFDSQKLFNEFH